MLILVVVVRAQSDEAIQMKGVKQTGLSARVAVPDRESQQLS